MAVTAPSWATRTSRPWSCAAPAQSPSATPRRSSTSSTSMHEEYILTEDNLWAHEEGTPVLVDVINGGGAFPTRNWSAGEFEGTSKINSESFQKIRTKKRACYQCAIGCRNFHATTFAGEEVRGEGPEYETIALCGANCGIDDIDALMKFNELCDELGLDTISSGAVVALAMDLTEKGVHDFGLRFGEVEGYVKAPELIVQARGHRRRARPRYARPGGQVRSPGAGDGGQGPRASGLRPARLLRHEHRLRDQRPRRLPHAHLPDRRRARRRHLAGQRDRRRQDRADRRRRLVQGLHRAEHELDQVQRHPLRLLGGHARAARDPLQGALGSATSATTRSSRSASASGTSAACSTCARASRRTTCRRSSTPSRAPSPRVPRRGRRSARTSSTP